MSDNDFIIIDEETKEKDTPADTRSEDNQETEKQEVVRTEKKDDDDNGGYEKICQMCHRPESVTGKIIDLPGGLTGCPDCMQRSFDSMTNGQFDMSRLMNIPGVQFLNLSDLENMQPRQRRSRRKRRSRRSSISWISRIFLRLIRSRQDWMNMWWDRSTRRRRCLLRCITITSV